MPHVSGAINEQAPLTQAHPDVQHVSNLTQNEPPRNVNRHSPFTAKGKIEVVSEVLATKAHVDAFRETRKRYITAENHLKDNTMFTAEVSSKQESGRSIML